MTAIMTHDFVTEFLGLAPLAADLGAGTGGILAGTKVATSIGWRPVQAIAEGDLVLTFDRGLQPVIRVQTHVLDLPRRPIDRAACPLHVPVGALGNLAPLVLMPGQSVLVESDLAEDMLGDAFVAVSAAALAGVGGIEPLRPADRLSVVTLHFAQDEVVFGAGGVLLVCTGRGDLMADLDDDSAYPTLPDDLARMIVAAGVLPAGSVGGVGQATGRAA